MQKSVLLSLISKYNNVGKIDSVIWEINDGTLKTKFISEDKSMIGEASVVGLKSDDTDAKLGIYKSSVLAKLLSILDNEISPLAIDKVGDKLVSIRLNDSKSKINYALSDLAVIPHVPIMKHIPQNFELSFKIDDEFSKTYLSAASSLPEVVTFSIEPTSDSIATITLGQTDVNTNRVYLTVNTSKSENMEKKFFNSELFSDILSANKGVEAEFEVSSEGLARIKFETREYTALYYLVAKKN